MKRDIILSGVGGQGILSIATIIGEAAISQGLNIKQAEVHGMSQRGGDVQSHLRISSAPIHSDLISLGGADAIISLEPMEALRYLPYLKQGGWIVTNSTPFINIPNYPEPEAIVEELKSYSNLIMFDVDTVSKENEVARAANMVLLGAASPILGIEYSALEAALQTIFGQKGEAVVSMNIKALRLGSEQMKSVSDAK